VGGPFHHEDLDHPPLVPYPSREREFGAQFWLPVRLAWPILVSCRGLPFCVTRLFDAASARLHGGDPFIPPRSGVCPSRHVPLSGSVSPSPTSMRSCHCRISSPFSVIHSSGSSSRAWRTPSATSARSRTFPDRSS